MKDLHLHKSSVPILTKLNSLQRGDYCLKGKIKFINPNSLDLLESLIR